MNIEQVKQDINHWIENFVEVPHVALADWPPCPFARQARLTQSFDVLLGWDPLFDLKNRSRWGMYNREVIIYVYNPALHDSKSFESGIAAANQEFLVPQGMIALGDHPDDVEIINGVCMNQGTYAMILVQSLSELDRRAQQIADKGFYHNWPEEYLQDLFRHRKDPR